MSDHRVHIILKPEHKTMLDELSEDKGLTASAVFRLLLTQAHKAMRRGARK